MKTYYVRKGKYGKWFPIKAKTKRNAVKNYCRQQGWKKVKITRRLK